MTLRVTDVAILRHCFRLVRRGALIWGVIFAAIIASSILGYESSFATLAERARLASGIAANTGVQALFGPARGLDTAAGFTVWRCAGVIEPTIAVWALLAATRLLRGEEDHGRWEVIRAGRTTAGRAAALAMLALGGALATIVVLVFATTLAAGSSHGVDAGGAAYFALALVTPGAVFAGVGAVTAQLASSRRQAASIGAGIFALALIARMIADSGSGAGWLRSATPLGWATQMHPLTGASALPVVPVALSTAGLCALALVLVRRRDLGGGLLPARDRSEPDLRLLGSAAGQAFRGLAGGLVAWTLGLAAMAFVFGAIAKTVANAAGPALARSARELGAGIASAEGYLGFTFLFLIVAVCCYGVQHVTAAREEEESGRLEALLAEPLTRARWLAGRIAVGFGCVVVACVAAGVGAWLGALAGGAGVGLGAAIEGGLNALPVTLLFAGLATLAFGLVPRETSMLAFGLIAITFLLQTVGATLGAPGWLLAPSPFHHLAIVPGGSIDVGASAVMVVVGLVAAACGIAAFGRRDIVEA